MVREANEAQRFIGAKFGTNPDAQKPGTYAVPVDTSKGPAFMKLVLTENKRMGGFELFWDEQLTLSWYDESQKPAEKPAESEFAQLFRKLEALRLKEQ